MATKSSARMRARRDLTEIKDQLRRERRERDERIEQAALTVRVSLRRAADAEVAAGHGIEALFAEGLTGKQVGQWCGGLSLTELRRLRGLLRRSEPVDGGRRTPDAEPNLAPDDSLEPSDGSAPAARTPTAS